MELLLGVIWVKFNIQLKVEIVLCQSESVDYIKFSLINKGKNIQQYWRAIFPKITDLTVGAEKLMKTTEP